MLSSNLGGCIRFPRGSQCDPFGVGARLSGAFLFSGPARSPLTETGRPHCRFDDSSLTNYLNPRCPHSRTAGHANVAITQKHYVHITPTDVLTRMDQAEESYVAMIAKAVANQAASDVSAEDDDEDELLCMAD